MTTYIDTSVLIPLFTEDSEHHIWCREQVERAERPIVVSDVVYAEVSVGMKSQDDVDSALGLFAMSRQSMSDEALFRAGRAFLEYKSNTGPKDSLLPDFFVGALADVAGEPLLTRDPSKVRRYFPALPLIHP